MMKTYLIRIVMFCLLVCGLTLVDFPLQLLRDGMHPTYAIDRRLPERHRRRNEPRHYPTPEPSTLILVGTGLAMGGAYALKKYRDNKRK